MEMTDIEPIGSERSVSVVKGARQNHQEQSDWIDFGRELYIPRSRHHEFSLVKKTPNGVFFI
jgi:hypothetical protein